MKEAVIEVERRMRHQSIAVYMNKAMFLALTDQNFTTLIQIAGSAHHITICPPKRGYVEYFLAAI